KVAKEDDLTQLKSLTTNNPNGPSHVKTWIKNNPNCSPREKMWIYEYATDNGHLDIIKHLLSVDQEPDKLFIAVQAATKGQLNILKYFIQDQKISINIIDEPVLLRAHGHKNIMKYLISQGVNANFFGDKPQFKEAHLLCTSILKEIEQERIAKFKSILRPLQPVRRRPKTLKI
ncbi:MAG: ankyrin repeat domain-containing protein, partial [Gammaproteobacteria bacterium]|nr:ankyrin repeat domain-containing protein [Gammaproteobacteria bacterium]